MMDDVSYKNFFKNYGIFLGIVAVVFMILIYFSLVSKKSWNNNLKVSIERVLDDYDPNNWTVGNNKPIKNPVCLNAACYEARSRRNGELYDAVIIRSATLYGPLAVVFVCDSENNVSFIGYSSLHGRINLLLKNNFSDKQIEYWKLKIPQIIGRTIPKEGSK